MWLDWSYKHSGKEKALKKTQFSLFIESRNLDLKFVFRFDKENKNLKYFNIQFHFKTKIECHFWPMDCIYVENFVCWNIWINQ